MKKNKMFLIFILMMSIVLNACSYNGTKNFENSRGQTNFDDVNLEENSIQTDGDLFKIVKGIGKLKSVTGGNEYVIIQDTITGCFYIHYAYANRMAMTPYYDETGTAVKGCYKNPNNKDSNE